MLTWMVSMISAEHQIDHLLVEQTIFKFDKHFDIRHSLFIISAAGKCKTEILRAL